MNGEKLGEITLGLTYRDRVTGYVGVAVGHSVWLTGSPTVCLQAPVAAGGKVPAPVSFDQPRLEAVPPAGDGTGQGALGL